MVDAEVHKASNNALMNYFLMLEPTPVMRGEDPASLRSSLFPHKEGEAKCYSAHVQGIILC